MFGCLACNLMEDCYRNNNNIILIIISIDHNKQDNYSGEDLKTAKQYLSSVGRRTKIQISRPGQTCAIMFGRTVHTPQQIYYKLTLKSQPRDRYTSINCGGRILVMWLGCRILDTEVDGSNPGSISMLCL